MPCSNPEPVRRIARGTSYRPEAAELLREGTETLRAAGVERPRWNAEQMLARRLKMEPWSLYLDPPAVPQREAERYAHDIASRAGGVPLQYLLGEAHFYGRAFEVGPGVFIPRPETEVLVEAVLTARLPRTGSGRRRTILDVGTGSGAIALTLALERPEFQVLGCDRSETALEFARANALRFGRPVRFFRSDLLGGLRPDSVDVLVANLPYLDVGTAAAWPRELAWEPWMALAGGKQGTRLLEALIRQADPVLAAGGRIFLEIAQPQADWLRAAAEASGFRLEQVVLDLAGRDRVAVLTRRQVARP